jgi:Cytochrome c oxidase subunit IV
VKDEANFLLFLAIFGFIIAVVFWAVGLAGVYRTTTGGGTVMLVAFGLLGLVPGAYYLWWSRRMTPRAEDNPNAVRADGAGIVGSFPSSSVWPFVLGFGFAMIALAFVFGLWTGVFGGAVLILGVAGVISESRRGGTV